MSRVLALLSLAPSVYGWGAMGHQTVGYVAQHYLSSATVTWAQGILGDTSDSYLANAATWADSYRYTTDGKFSAPFHFIDANDSPPSSCSVDYTRDCGAGGCVVSAIKNYTQRVQDGRLTAAHTMQALEFLIHFFGDITQPLHDEAHEVGGNDIAVTFDGTKTNLHHIWDTDMLTKYRGGSAESDAETWANALVTEINSGDYSSKKAGWISGMKLSDPQGSAMAWASDANQFVCSTALKGGDSAVEGTDLGGAYYQSAVPVFTQQIAKGGYRLAAWLNLIVTGKTGM